MVCSKATEPSIKETMSISHAIPTASEEEAAKETGLE